MIRNVGSAERWTRVIGGVGLMTIGLTLSLPFWAEEVAEVVGLLAVVTGAVGYCPVKHLLKRTGHARVQRPREDT